MFETLSIVGLVVLGQITKKFILPRWGNTGLQVFLFVVAMGVVGVKSAMTVYPGLKEVLIQAGTYLAGAIALYEVLVSKIGDAIKGEQSHM